MKMRKKIVGSSWKMHINSLADGKLLAKEICEKVGNIDDVDIFLLPTFPMIHTVAEELKGYPVTIRTMDIDNRVDKQVLKMQIEWALNRVSTDFRKKVVFAYEPVWAIGKSEAADSKYVNETHIYIRNTIEDLFGKEVAEEIRVIYGGSVSPETAPELIKYENVDGLFIGRFGLKSENFKSMIDSAIKASLVENV